MDDFCGLVVSRLDPAMSEQHNRARLFPNFFCLGSSLSPPLPLAVIYTPKSSTPSPLEDLAAAKIPSSRSSHLLRRMVILAKPARRGPVVDFSVALGGVYGAQQNSLFCIGEGTRLIMTVSDHRYSCSATA